MIQNLQITAADSLFFRDAKPFSMGEETWASNLFPNVPPSAFLGALRTAFASEHKIDKGEILDKTLSAEIKNIGIILGTEPAFPIPLDLIGYENQTLGLYLEEARLSSNPFSKILISKESKKAKTLDTYRMPLSILNRYLEGEKEFVYNDDKNDSDFLNITHYSTLEPKVGISRNKHTNTVENSMLYRVGMFRMEGKNKRSSTSFFLTINNLQLPKEGILRLGAENKIAKYNLLSKKITPNTINNWNGISTFKLYLSTPAILDNGIIPKWINQESMTGNINGVPVQLQTCTIGKFIALGGFDIKEQKPKPMYKAVPAGSIYYFELINKEYCEKQMGSIVSYFQDNSFSEQKCNEGLGVVYVAKQ